MPLTTIPLEKKTRDKLREFAKKSESWDDLMNRLYENAINTQNARIFFSSRTLTADELLQRIDQW